MKRYQDDVIVIGSGMGGLASALYLARNGYRVKVFERLSQPGGYVNTFTRGGYTFESTTHQFSGLLNPLYMKRTLQMLGIPDLGFIHQDSCYETVVFNDKFEMAERVIIPTGKANILKMFKQSFPEDYNDVLKFFNTCKQISLSLLRLKRLMREQPIKHLFDAILGLFLLKGREGSLMKALGIKRHQVMIKYVNQSFSELLDDHIRNNNVKFLLSQYSYYLGTEPSKVAAIVIAIMSYLYFMDGPLWIKGGTKTLLDYMIKKILDNQGEIVYRSPVKKILIEQGKACGVILENGDTFRCRFVVSNVNAKTTYSSLIESARLSESLKKKVDGYKASRSAFIVYLGLPYTLNDYGLDSSMFIFSGSKDVEKEMRQDNLLSDSSPFIMSNYSVLDPGFSPAGKSSVVLAEYADYHAWTNLESKPYQTKKSTIQQMLINKTARITGLPLDKAEVCFSATPRTLERYTGNINGAIVGAEMTVGQSGRRRFTNQSEIRNLFLAGHDVMPAGSVGSAIDSGVISGRLIRKSR